MYKLALLSNKTVLAEIFSSLVTKTRFRVLKKVISCKLFTDTYTV